jgi:hypothetical protein
VTERFAPVVLPSALMVSLTGGTNKELEKRSVEAIPGFGVQRSLKTE